MIKKKAKGKTAAKKTARKKSGSKNSKEPNPAEVRKDISLMVEEQAAEMTRAVIEEGKKGQLAPVKFLLEVARIFPAPTDGSEATQEEESLAKTLLRRLDLPDEPIVRDENGEIIKGSPANKAAETSGADSGSGASDEKPEAKVESSDPVVA
jgi:hypothetical protein